LSTRLTVASLTPTFAATSASRRDMAEAYAEQPQVTCNSRHV
jgi:hypothetical protein